MMLSNLQPHTLTFAVHLDCSNLHVFRLNLKVNASVQVICFKYYLSALSDYPLKCFASLSEYPIFIYLICNVLPMYSQQNTQNFEC
jgi:hypothetical protein